MQLDQPVTVISLTDELLPILHAESAKNPPTVDCPDCQTADHQPLASGAFRNGVYVC